jgi:hypothetical protein
VQGEKLPIKQGLKLSQNRLTQEVALPLNNTPTLPNAQAVQGVKTPAIPALANITKNKLEQPKLKLLGQAQYIPKGVPGDFLSVSLPKSSLKVRRSQLPKLKLEQ